MFKNTLLCFIAYCCFAGWSTAQTYKFRSYGPSQGIEQRFIYTINQSRDGYLLVGTEDGLLKFGGVSFKKIELLHNVESPGIITVSNHIEESKIWYGYNDGRLVLLHLRDYTVIFDSVIAQGSITGILGDKQRNVWVSTASDGLYRIDGKLDVTHYDLGEYEGELQINGINLLPPAELVLATNIGLLSMNISEIKRSTSIPPKEVLKGWSAHVTVLTRAKDSLGVFVGTKDDGVWFYRGNKKGGSIRQLKLWDESKGKNVKALIEGKDDLLWISIAGEGLYTYSRATKTAAFKHTHYDDSNGLLSNSIRSLYSDFEGNIWIGHYGQGLTSFLDNFLEFYNIRIDDRIKTVNAIVGVENDFYLGLDDGLIKITQGNWQEPEYILPKLKSKKITSIVIGSDGKLWIGTERESAWFWDPNRPGTASVQLVDEGASKFINYLLPVKNGIWIASKGGLRYLNYDLTGDVTFTMNDGLPSNNVSCLFAQGEAIWIASYISVVARYKEGAFEQFILNTGETVVNIVGMSTDIDGEIWVATDGKGIIKVKGHGARSFMKSSGLESNYCQGLLTDKYSNFLVLHRGSISRIWGGLTGVDVLDEDNGIDGEFNQNAIFTDESGNIWLGTSNGVLKYIPDNNDFESRGPAIHVVSVKIGDQDVDFSKNLELSYGPHRLEIQYEGVSFKNGKNIRYQYILEGYDEEWSAWTSSDIVVYRKLLEGKYRFRVRACLSDDACTTSTALVSLNVNPPFWKAWWFYIMVAVAATLVVRILIKVRERNFKKKEQYLQSELQDRIQQVIEHEHELEEKNKELKVTVRQKETLLKEVHHRVKNNLQLVSSLLSLQARNVDNETVSEILRNSQIRIGTMALLHKKLYSSEDIGNVPVQDYVENLSEAIADAYETDMCKVKLHIDIADVKFGLDTAVPLGLILNEIITNSYKYAFGDRSEGNISISLVHLDGERYKLTVGDDGIGLPKGFDIAKSNSLGLELVNVLTEQLSGNVTCVSTKKGTKYSITFNVSPQ